MTEALDAAGFAARLLQVGAAGRVLVALAGAPGSGKSTLATDLAQRIEAAQPGWSVVVPMDGFHYDDAVLEARGWRARKGAPHTFDVGGLSALLRRLKANTEPEIAFPAFDRRLELSRAGARIALPTARVVVVEGNYLLLDQDPWAGLAEFFDITALAACSYAELERRLTQRWQGYGVDPEETARRLEENDLPNGRLVLTESRPADVSIATGPI